MPSREDKNGTIWVIEERYRGATGPWRLCQPYHLYKVQTTGIEVTQRLNSERWRFEYRLAEYRRKEKKNGAKL